LTGYAAGPASANLAQLINRNLRSAVVNIDPAKIEPLTKKIFQRRPQFPGLFQAYGLIEVALLDLRGKIEGCTVSDLLGPRKRARVPLVVSEQPYLAVDRIVAAARSWAGVGCQAFKFRPGLGPDADAAAVQRVREALPSEVTEVVDAQSWWRMGSVHYPPERFESWVREIAGFSNVWLAEPFSAANAEVYWAHNRVKPVPVAAGEHETDAHHLFDLASKGQVDILRANVMLLGGVRRSWETLQGSEKRFILCGAVTPLEVLTMAHLGSCFSDDLFVGVEYPCYPLIDGRNSSFPLGEVFLKETLSIERGELLLPRGAGLGAEVDEEVIHRYPWKSGPAQVLQ
jgi:L-alanine-DL-glutamate epimerase-like enolase superfamily enzyme